MDNIAKMVFGVVALIGLILMVIPRGDPLSNAAPASPATGTVTPAGPPDPIADEAPKNEPETATTINAPTQEIAPFGQPMLDPTPPGQRQAQQQQQQAQQQGGGEGNTTGEEAVAPFPSNPAGGAPAIPHIQ